MFAPECNKRILSLCLLTLKEICPGQVRAIKRRYRLFSAPRKSIILSGNPYANYIKLKENDILMILTINLSPLECKQSYHDIEIRLVFGKSKLMKWSFHGGKAVKNESILS